MRWFLWLIAISMILLGIFLILAAISIQPYEGGDHSASDLWLKAGPALTVGGGILIVIVARLVMKSGNGFGPFGFSMLLIGSIIIVAAVLSLRVLTIGQLMFMLVAGVPLLLVGLYFVYVRS